MTVADGLGTAGAGFSFAGPAVDDIARVECNSNTRRWGREQTTLGVRVLTTGPRMRDSRRAIMVGRPEGCALPHIPATTRQNIVAHYSVPVLRSWLNNVLISATLLNTDSTGYVHIFVQEKEKVETTVAKGLTREHSLATNELR